MIFTHVSGRPGHQIVLLCFRVGSQLNVRIRDMLVKKRLSVSPLTVSGALHTRLDSALDEWEAHRTFEAFWRRDITALELHIMLGS